MLLDTCALLWLVHQPENLSNSLLNRINAEPVIYISSITGSEIGIKYKSGKLELPVPPKTWLETVLKHHDISVIEIDSAIRSFKGSAFNVLITLRFAVAFLFPIP